MYPMYQPFHINSLSSALVQHRLFIAQQKLLKPRLPMPSKFKYYLRVCCAVMQKVEWAGWSLPSTAEKSKLSYGELMAALTERNPEWWQTCYVDTTGLLQSEDPAIRQLLEPIAELYYRGQLAIAPHPSNPYHRRSKLPTRLAV